MLQNKTTYYLGAGASCNALPLANKLKEEIRTFLNLLDPQNGASDILSSKYSKELYLKYSNAIQGIDAFPTVDAFAKSLQERKSRKEIQALSELVSIFFIYKQIDCTRLLRDSGMGMNETVLKPFKGAFDMRYLSFMSKVYNEGQLNQNLSVISWNYDLQFEIALAKYLRIDFYNVLDLLNMYPNHGKSNFIPTNKIHKLVKLNGTAGLWSRMNNSSRVNLYNNIDLEVLLNDAEIQNSFFSTLGYAWDNSEIQKNSITIAQQIMKETENLVIIGYSFPDFNWELDYKILNNSSVRRVYVQVREDDFQQIKYKLEDVVRPNVSIEQVPVLDDFYLPLHARNIRSNYLERVRMFKN